MLAIFLLAACTDITPIEDGQRLGDLVILKDLFTSVQLLEVGERVLLFDGGYRARVIEDQLAGQGLALDEVTDVFLTHGHADHLDVVPELPDATVYALPAEAERIEEESDGAVSIDHALSDRERVALGSVTVEVFAVPGHTAGSAVYLVEGALILGDCVRQDRDGELVVEDGKHSEDPELLRESLRALADALEARAEEVSWLVPAHTAPVQGFEALQGL